MIPTTIGNMIGGGIFVGAVYWYLFLTGEGSVNVDFNTGGLGAAMEVGGPMGDGSGKGRQRQGNEDGDVIEGRDIDEKHGSGDTLDHTKELPHSGGKMKSGFGKELSGDHITGRKGMFEMAKIV